MSRVVVNIATVAALLALLMPTVAFADVLPEGQKSVTVENHLQGVDAFADDYTFLLVTLNNMDRERVQTRFSGLAGHLKVPGGYQNESMLVALTAAQLVELATLAIELPQFTDTRTELAAKSDDDLRTWIVATELHEESAAAVREFFERDDVGKSPAFSFRTFVDAGDPVETLRRHYTVTAVSGGTITLQLGSDVERLDASGEPAGPAPGFMSWLVGVIVAAFVALLGLFSWRRRRSRAPIPDDAI